MDVLPALLPLGIGFGLAMPALATLAMSAATPEDSGIASGMFNTMQQIGAAFGLEVLSTLANAYTDALLGDEVNTASALTGGYQLAFRIGACLGAVSLLLATALLRSPAPAPRPAVEEMAVAEDTAH